MVCECGKARTLKPLALPFAIASSVCIHICGDAVMLRFLGCMPMNEM